MIHDLSGNYGAAVSEWTTAQTENLVLLVEYICRRSGPPGARMSAMSLSDPALFRSVVSTLDLTAVDPFASDGNPVPASEQAVGRLTNRLWAEVRANGGHDPRTDAISPGKYGG